MNLKFIEKGTRQFTPGEPKARIDKNGSLTFNVAKSRELGLGLIDAVKIGIDDNALNRCFYLVPCNLSERNSYKVMKNGGVTSVSFKKPLKSLGQNFPINNVAAEKFSHSGTVGIKITV